MKYFLYAATSLVILATLVSTEFANALVRLLIAGVVPGTNYTIPYWLTMSVYSALIAMIVTHYVEQWNFNRRNKKAVNSSASRMPRRRYSHI
ncbi:MAG: hypothetical protein WAQ25_00025 [Candidatus Saccharimonas sp.]